ncbi:acyltransferase family protein [Pseudonocardia sp. WMMC193]|uniref:acyltransferase family protein n=1 Tax=Pseudonocardia sp. WMMC193 TaxID=2911965 RepID=UPI001F21D51F|nr:acyltransferase family protein [Pseudonocardia sp. WMMC193]MCF7551020.1 acyltransferase [Pseudonocardia sp. WMMC193]
MSQAHPGPSDETTSALQQRTRRFRPELQGLRALAVLLVVVYHVWFGRVSGGVDVFFVISGFLITGQLHRAAARGTLRFRPMWARQAARLLPAAFTVLLGAVAAGWLLLPEARWQQTLNEVFSSAVFLENWRLAADSVDYAAQHNTQSLVQHFWSLSIQVQFYIVWPLLVALVALMAANRLVVGSASSASARERLRAYLLLALGGLFVASLSYSVMLTLTDQPLAYFHSLTRVWEFALGGLLALTIDSIVLSARTRLLLGWVGVVGLIACGAVLQVDAVFPGFAALWPTGAACLVLIAGATGSRAGADRILSSRPLKYVGDVSYALYLWHWPLLILFLVTRDQEAVGLRGGLAIIALAFVLAVLTHHFVEEPIRRASISDRARYRGAAAGLVVVLLAAGAWQWETTARASSVAVVGDESHPGALAMRGGPAVTQAPLIPPLVTAQDDWSRIEYWNCVPMSRLPENAACTLPPLDPAVPPVERVVVVGDSHAQQFTAAMVPWAHARNVELTAIIHGACPFSTASEVYPDDPVCLNFNDAAAGEIADLHPNVVVTLASRDVQAGLTEVTPPGFVDRWRELDAQGIRVIALRDNPRFAPEFRPADCLQQAGRGSDQCSLQRAQLYAPVPPWEAIPDLPPNVSFLDYTDYFCGPQTCPVEAGNVLMYLDFNHITATYMTSLAPVVGEDFDRILGV